MDRYWINIRGEPRHEVDTLREALLLFQKGVAKGANSSVWNVWGDPERGGGGSIKIADFPGIEPVEPAQRFMVYFQQGSKLGQEQECESLEAAQKVAIDYGCSPRPAKPFPNEPTYLYGPGDGTTSVMIRRKRA